MSDEMKSFFEDGIVEAILARWICGMIAVAVILVYFVPQTMPGVIGGTITAWAGFELKRWKKARSVSPRKVGE